MPISPSGRRPTFSEPAACTYLGRILSRQGQPAFRCRCASAVFDSAACVGAARSRATGFHGGRWILARVGREISIWLESRCAVACGQDIPDVGMDSVAAI